MKEFKKIDDKVWLETSEDINGEIRANRIRLKGIDIFSFVDKNGIPRIIFENAMDNLIKVPKLKTIGVDNVRYTIENQVEKLYLEISCNVLGFKRYYYDFTNKLLNYLVEGFNLMDSFYKAFDEWKAFLHIKGSALTIEEQYGLLAELFVLCDLIESLKPKDAFLSWRGPFRELDFKFQNLEIEVKATLKKKHEHVINGLDQLLKLKDKLGMISVCLTRVDNGGISLPDFVLRVEDLLQKHPALLFEFRGILHEKLNYNLEDEDDYNSNRFEIREVNYFDILDNSPVFTSKNLSTPLTDNISNIEYTLDLTNLQSISYQNALVKSILDGI
jgi:hypothetical protein